MFSEVDDLPLTKTKNHPTATIAIKIKAGNPPRLDSIFTPSIPEKEIMTHATKPMINPQRILMALGAS